MNCHEWQAIWQNVLDGDDAGIDRAAWSAHLKDCANCRELHETGERLFSALRRLPPLAPPSALADTVLAAVRHEDRRQRMRVWVGVGTSLAAAALIWGIVRVVFFPQTPQPSRNPVAPEVAATPPPSLDAQLAEAQTATIDLTRRVARDTVRHASLFVPPPPERWAGIGGTADGPQTAAVPVRQMGQSVSNSLEPVTASTRRAFDMFWKLLPPAELDKPHL
jgi:hypothetical protein